MVDIIPAEHLQFVSLLTFSSKQLCTHGCGLSFLIYSCEALLSERMLERIPADKVTERRDISLQKILMNC